MYAKVATKYALLYLNITTLDKLKFEMQEHFQQLCLESFTKTLMEYAGYFILLIKKFI